MDSPNKSPISKSLQRINDFYRDFPRPATFVDRHHCSECAEHEATLQSQTVESITLKELGNPGWDPICFLTSMDAYRYYLPAMARLACGFGEDFYLDQFLFHLNPVRVRALSNPERLLLAEFLEELTLLMPEEIDHWYSSKGILQRIRWLRDPLST